MPITTRTDLIIPELLQEAISAEFAGVTVLENTEAAIINNTLPPGARGGDTLKVPYFNTLGEMEDLAEGEALTPVKLTMSSETATAKHSGKAVELTHWATLAATADPYVEVARQFRSITVRRVDKALIEGATASLPAEFVHDVSNVTPHTITYDDLVDTQMKFGDEQGAIVFLTVHSKVYGDMLKLKDTTGRPLLVLPDSNNIARFAGIPIRVSDKNTVIAGTPNKYVSTLFKRQSVVFWFNDQPRVLTDADILADTHVLAIHMYYLTHRYLRLPGTTKPGVVKLITN
jgi:HK97 family phage major capsid protein